MIIEGGKRLQNISKVSSTEKPLVSIITAVLNGEKYLEHTINSVIEQTYDNIEYIILDGGSTDSSVQIIQKYNKFIDYWSSREDNGVSDAFNNGIEKSLGEIIGIINSDDWYEKNAVEKVVNVYKSNHADLICGAVQFWRYNHKINISFSDINKIIKETSIHHSTVFIKRNIYNKYGHFDKSYKFAMDYELLLRLKMKNLFFYPINDVIANRRLIGLSYVNRKEALKETRRARLNYFSIINAWSNYFYVYIKDYIGRLLKTNYFLWVYRIYWDIKNKSLAKDKSL